MSSQHVDEHMYNIEVGSGILKYCGTKNQIGEPGSSYRFVFQKPWNPEKSSYHLSQSDMRRNIFFVVNPEGIGSVTSSGGPESNSGAPPLEHIVTGQTEIFSDRNELCRVTRTSDTGFDVIGMITVSVPKPHHSAIFYTAIESLNRRINPYRESTVLLDTEPMMEIKAPNSIGLGEIEGYKTNTMNSYVFIGTPRRRIIRSIFRKEYMTIPFAVRVFT
jgi:hypothetical protein